jgi:hypothetical protein
MVTADFLDSAHWALSDAVTIFYGKYLKEKKLK